MLFQQWALTTTRRILLHNKLWIPRTTTYEFRQHRILNDSRHLLAPSTGLVNSSISLLRSQAAHERIFLNLAV